MVRIFHNLWIGDSPDPSDYLQALLSLEDGAGLLYTAGPNQGLAPEDAAEFFLFLEDWDATALPCDRLFQIPMSGWDNTVVELFFQSPEFAFLAGAVEALETTP